MRHLLCVVIIAIGFSISAIAQSVVPEEPNQEALASKGTKQKFQMGDRDFVVVSKEWAYQKETGEPVHFLATSRGVIKTSKSWPGGIKTEKEYKDLQRRLDKIAPGAYRIEDYGHTLLIKSTGDYPEEDIKYISSLDLPISLELSEVSTWEAFKQLNLVLNEQPDLRVLNKLGWLFMQLRPSVMFNKNVISLDMQNVPARDVLIEILRQSPLPISYDYRLARSKHDEEWVVYTKVLCMIHDSEGDVMNFEVDGKLYAESPLPRILGLPNSPPEDRRKFFRELNEANVRWRDYFVRKPEE